MHTLLKDNSTTSSQTLPKVKASHQGAIKMSKSMSNRDLNIEQNNRDYHFDHNRAILITT